ncbi:MAG: hypothetical protein EA352_01515 [Gemmatimonadales bacterium]|nr:MAG: hypothetical protein EA352_01515 [Gemmatimonadales bacterium]
MLDSRSRRTLPLSIPLLLLGLLALAGCNEPGSDSDNDLDEIRLGSMDFEAFGGTAVSRFELEGVAVMHPPETDGAEPVVDVTMEGSVQGVTVGFRLRGALDSDPGPMVPQTPHPLEGDATLESLESWANAQPIIQFTPGALHLNPRSNEVFVPFGQTDLFLLRYWPPENGEGGGEIALGGLSQFIGIVPGEFTDTGVARETGNVLASQFVLRVPMTCAELAC